MEIVRIVQSDAFREEINNMKDILADSSLSERLADKKKRVVLRITKPLYTHFWIPTAF